MPFQKGNKLRSPKSGRKPGAHNKITRDVAALLDSLNCNPLQGLATIATDSDVEIPIRARCYAELAKYVHPQLKAIEHSGSIKTGTDGGSESSTERILRDLAEETTESPTGTSSEAHDGAGASGVSHNMGLPSAAEPEATRNAQGGNPTI
jgi:hypothetical protein